MWKSELKNGCGTVFERANANKKVKWWGVSTIKKPKILFVYPIFSSFVKIDLELLRHHYDVKAIHWTRTRDVKRVLTVMKYVYTTDLCFVWFAARHAAWIVHFSKIFRKKTIVVASGYCVTNMPEINYGLMRFPKTARRVKFVLKNADKILAVSEFNKREILNYTNPENVKLVYHGFDNNKFKPNGEKENLVITVGEVKDSNVKRKGLETFVKSAKFLPKTRFVLIGTHMDNSLNYLRDIASPNIEFTDFVPFDKLLNYYQKAKVYVQVSAHEGFGCSLAEAMLCECVPVVTERGAIPEVVGDIGFYVPYGNPKATAEAIKKALKSDQGGVARERIKNMFSIKKREDVLLRIIEVTNQKE